MEIYALRHIKSGKLLSVSIESNGDAEFCNSCTVSFEIDGDIPWVTKDLQYIQYIRCADIGWYNSCIESPSRGSIESKDLEIVDLSSDEVIPSEELPSFFDVAQVRKTYILPWQIEDAKKSKEYPFLIYKEYLELKGTE